MTTFCSSRRGLSAPLVDRPGLEPGYPACETGVFPLDDQPEHPRTTVRGLTCTTMPFRVLRSAPWVTRCGVVDVEGIEPSASCLSSRYSAAEFHVRRPDRTCTCTNPVMSRGLCN